jgi:hypothetical protein
VPIKPEECVPVCSGFILQHATKDQLKGLGLSDKTAEAITKARMDCGKKTPPDLDRFQKALTESECSEASKAIKGLKQKQLDTLLSNDDIRAEARKVPSKEIIGAAPPYSRKM